MVDVIAPEHYAVRYDAETTYGDGGYDDDPCTGYNPAWEWIGIIEDISRPYDNAMRECRGIGSVDVAALATGMKNPEITLKWIIQRKRTVATAFNPLTFMNYAVTPPVGITIADEATYGASPSYVTFWYKGMMMDSLDVEFDIDGFQRATAKLVGQDLTVAAALIAGDSRAANPIDLTNLYALPLTGQDAEVFVNAAGAGDSPIDKVKKVHFFIKNNYVRIPVVRATSANLLKYILRSKRELGGELTLFVEDKTEIDWLLASTPLDIRIDLQKTDNTPYFDFTGVKLDTGNLATRINEVPCEFTVPFKATAVSAA